jgi:hypothetical protein
MDSKKSSTRKKAADSFSLLKQTPPHHELILSQSLIYMRGRSVQYFASVLDRISTSPAACRETAEGLCLVPGCRGRVSLPRPPESDE